MSLEGHDSALFISGRFDIVAELDDGTYVVMDFKTGKPNEEESAMYARQLHAYDLTPWNWSSLSV